MECPGLPFRTIALPVPLLRFLCWTARPKGVEVAGTPLKGRKEQRVALKMFVTLSSPGECVVGNRSTIDTVCHGARVVTRRSGAR